MSGKFYIKPLLIALILFTGCQGRYASLGRTMTDCGFKRVSYTDFHNCMNNKIPASNSHSQDYYAKTNNEIRSQLDFYAQQIADKRLKEKDAYEDFVSFVNNKIIEEQKSAQVATTIVAVSLAGVAVAACANNGGCGYPSNSYYYDEPYMCSSCPSCAPVCTIGKACGNTCIEITDTCHVGRGSACNINWRSYP